MNKFRFEKKINFELFKLKLILKYWWAEKAKKLFIY